MDPKDNAEEYVSKGIVSGLRAVVRAATELPKSTDLDDLFRQGVRFALDHLNVERCAIFIVDGEYLQGTFGTNSQGELVDERAQQVPLDDTWANRIEHLETHGPAWAKIEDYNQNEWDGKQALQVGVGWVVITPIFSAGELVGIFINDCAISGGPSDASVQEVIAVYCSLFGSILERKKADLKLYEERNLLRTLIDTLPDFIYVKDLNSRLVINNLAYALLSGTSEAQAHVGKTDLELYGPEIADVYRSTDQQVIRTGQPVINHEERGKGPNGELLWVLTTKVPLRDKEGHLIGVVGMTRDITPLKQAQAALERSNEVLEERVQRRVSELALANEALQKEMEERRRAEELLQHERNLLRTVIDHVPDLIYVKDIDGFYMLANLHCAEVIGVERIEDIIGKTDRDLYGEGWQPFHEAEQRVMNTGEPLISQEERSVNREGIERWFLTTKIPFRDQVGQVSGLVGVSRDITRRKLAEQQLRESEELFAKAFYASPLAICISQLSTGIFLDLNSRLLELTGYVREDLIGRTSIELPFIAKNGDQSKLLTLIVEQGGIRDHETALIKKSGERRDVLVSAELIELNGETCALVMMQDITDRKAMQKELFEERKLLRTLLDTLPDYIFVKDRSGRFVLSNLAHARAAGVINPYEFTGKMAAEFFPSELAAQYDADDRAVMDSGRALISIERTTLDEFGKPMFVSTTKVPLRDEVGEIIGVVGISRDITAKRRTEKILRESEERYRSLFELSPDGILVYYNGIVVYANKAAVSLFGALSTEEIIGRTSDEFITAHDKDIHHALSPAVLASTDKAFTVETQLKRLDGSFLKVELIAAPVKFSDIAGIQIIIRDVSERLQAEAAKRESERLRIALEQEKELRDLKSKLMVTISHEFRTPMTIAQSSADILEDYFDRMPAEKRKEHLAKIIGQIQLLTGMMEDITFVIQASFEELSVKAEPVNLKKLCETIVGEMQASDTVFHRIEMHCADGLPQLTLDLRRIKYVIMNLLSNAMKFSESDTTVTVTVDRQDNHVMITVQDEGIGISLEEQLSVFDPFYRGENIGVIRGTGIGLSIVKEIVDQHKGTIQLDSELGRGTKVTVMLPISDESSDL